MNSEPYWSLICKACQDVSVRKGPGVFLSGYQTLDGNVASLFAAHWVLAEFSAGGLLRFFISDAGMLAPEAADAFDSLDLPAVARAVREGMEVFGRPYPRERARRIEILAQKAGVRPASVDWLPLDAAPFDRLDRTLARVGGEHLEKIRDQMNACAEHRAEHRALQVA